MIRQICWIIIVLAVALAGCSSPAPTPRPVAPQPTPRGSSAFEGRTVSASAEVVPRQKAQLSFVLAGSVEKVSIAVGDSVKAGDVLAGLETASLELAVKQAEVAQQRAQARLAEVKAGPRAQEITMAQAALAAAQANLRKLRAAPDENLLLEARAQAANAEAAVRQAQAGYDRAGGATNPYASMLPTSLQLEQATNNSLAAKARLQSLQRGPLWADVEAAQAEIQRLQAQLELIKAGPRTESIAAAEVEVSAAQVGIEAAKVALNQAQLRAPFDGQIAAVSISAGEVVGPGQVVLVLADLDHLQVETTDLSERSVSRVVTGQPVNIFMEPLNQELKGWVVRVAPRSNKLGGDVVYAVTIDLDGPPAGLRWGMSAKVDIAIQQ